MGQILVVDAGTSAVKAALIADSDVVVSQCTCEIPTYQHNGEVTQDPENWWGAFKEAIKSVLAEEGPQVSAVALSGQMQDVVLTDGVTAVCDAILYSDARATDQAARIADMIGKEEILRTTGNGIDGSIPFAKLLWMKENVPAVLAGAKRVVFSSKDYINAQLTGKWTTDTVTASTSGMMDIESRRWRRDWLARAGLEALLLPTLLTPTELVGNVTPEAAEETGLPEGVPVFAGIGDAGAATLGSGILNPGEYSINLGTSSWVASVSKEVPLHQGIFNLAGLSSGWYINTVPFYNGGIVHQWITKILEGTGEDRYELMDMLLEKSEPGSNGVLFLPYLRGERYPSDDRIRGAFYGLTPETEKQDMARACLEAVAFSMKSGFRDHVRSVTLVGGGARVRTWCQIFADVLGCEVRAFENGEFMPALAVAALARVGIGDIISFEEYAKKVAASQDCSVYKPISENAAILKQAEKRFAKLYPALKTMEK